MLYQAVESLGVPPDAHSAFLPGEAHLPVVPWTEAIYALTYPFVLLAPLTARRQGDLRRFALRGLGATALIIPLYLLLPIVAQAKSVPDGSSWALPMRWERLHDQPVTAFPAFHVVWALLAAQLDGVTWPRLRVPAWTVAAGIAISCVTTGMHASLDVIAALAAYLLVTRGSTIWAWLCRGTEAVANSWHEWSIGPVRVINHGVWAGLGAVGGLLVALPLAGPGQLGWLVAMVAAAVLGAALWAQLVEGSPQLLRPYGYFGSAVAVVTMGVLAAALGECARRCRADEQLQHAKRPEVRRQRRRDEQGGARVDERADDASAFEQVTERYEEKQPESVADLGRRRDEAGAIVTALLIGREQGRLNNPEIAGTLCFILLVSLTVYVTLDLNRPERGLIRVSQEPMDRLLSSMPK